MENKKSEEGKNDVRYSPVGEKECQGKCQRDILMTENGAIIVCNFCERIVIDNRK